MASQRGYKKQGDVRQLTQEDIDQIHLLLCAGAPVLTIMRKFDICSATVYKVKKGEGFHEPSELAKEEGLAIKAEKRRTINTMTAHLVDGRGAQMIEDMIEHLGNPEVMTGLVEEGKVDDVRKLYDTMMKHAYKRQEILIKEQANQIEEEKADKQVSAINELIAKLSE